MSNFALARAPGGVSCREPSLRRRRLRVPPAQMREPPTDEYEKAMHLLVFIRNRKVTLAGTVANWTPDSDEEIES